MTGWTWPSRWQLDCAELPGRYGDSVKSMRSTSLGMNMRCWWWVKTLPPTWQKLRYVYRNRLVLVKEMIMNFGTFMKLRQNMCDRFLPGYWWRLRQVVAFWQRSSGPMMWHRIPTWGKWAADSSLELLMEWHFYIVISLALGFGEDIRVGESLYI